MSRDGMHHTAGTVSIKSIKGEVDANNSTSTTLDADEVYTGDWTNVLDVGMVIVTVYSDQASATDGLHVDFSMDGSTHHNEDLYTIPAATGKTFSFQTAAKWFRVTYTNGSVDQNEFQLQTIFKQVYTKPSSHRIQDAISTDDDAELTKSVITGLDTVNSTFKNVNVSQDGNLTISDNSNGLAIAQGNVTGATFVHKFGAAPDFDENPDGEVTVWDGAEDGTAWENMVYDYSATADIDSISSSDSGDTSIDIEVQGLDENYDLVTQTVTLDASDSQTRVALSTDLIRVFRAKNVSSTNLTGHVLIYPNTGLTSGVPTDKSKIRAIIHPENNQTEMAIYTIPNGKTGYLRSWYAATGGANKTSNYIVRLKARPFGQVFQLKHRSSIQDGGTSYIQHRYVEPEVFAAKTDIEMTAEVAKAGVTAASVVAGFDIVLVDD